ncbi:hypothetical protein QQF64_018251 [Cirrhinus molitorella]|uniref:Uncharacterized protein n=1 Tax=Cirrhinus molitorella TaxID=172907 RepID=A0ABR3LKZ0_9TELE
MSLIVTSTLNNKAHPKARLTPAESRSANAFSPIRVIQSDRFSQTAAKDEGFCCCEFYDTCQSQTTAMCEAGNIQRSQSREQELHNKTQSPVIAETNTQPKEK